jgi:hypothetical protein
MILETLGQIIAAFMLLVTVFLLVAYVIILFFYAMIDGIIDIIVYRRYK